jgi:hypothetical protein
MASGCKRLATRALHDCDSSCEIGFVVEVSDFVSKTPTRGRPRVLTPAPLLPRRVGTLYAPAVPDPDPGRDDRGLAGVPVGGRVAPTRAGRPTSKRPRTSARVNTPAAIGWLGATPPGAVPEMNTARRS